MTALFRRGAALVALQVTVLKQEEPRHQLCWSDRLSGSAFAGSGPFCRSQQTGENYLLSLARLVHCFPTLAVFNMPIPYLANDTYARQIREIHCRSSRTATSSPSRASVTLPPAQRTVWPPTRSRLVSGARPSSVIVTERRSGLSLKTVR